MKLINLKQLFAILFFVWAIYLTYTVTSLSRIARADGAFQASTAKLSFVNCYTYFFKYGTGSMNGVVYEKLAGMGPSGGPPAAFGAQQYVSVQSAGNGHFFVTDAKGSSDWLAPGYTVCNTGDVMIGAKLRSSYPQTYGAEFSALGIDILCCKLYQ